MTDFKGSLFDLDGRIALVTGGSKGIGRAIVERMIQHGAQVAFTSRDLAAAQGIASELNARAGREVALGLSCDVTRLVTAQSAVDAVIGHWGRIDILVCNAAELAYAGPSATTSEKKFLRLLETNIYNTFRLCHAVADTMKERRDGSLILITSASGTRGNPYVLAYGVSKAGETHMARLLAAELAPFNIRVNCVAPGFTRSEASRRVWENETALKTITRTIPLDRMGEADEVAAGVIFLASPGGAWTTGVSLGIDGGTFERFHAPNLPPSRAL